MSEHKTLALPMAAIIGSLQSDVSRQLMYRVIMMLSQGAGDWETYETSHVITASFTVRIAFQLPTVVIRARP